MRFSFFTIYPILLAVAGGRHTSRSPMVPAEQAIFSANSYVPCVKYIETVSKVSQR